MSTTLYRLFASDGELLYVGIADSWPSRMRQHARDKPWWAEVTNVRLEHHALRSIAEEAERIAIRIERPRHNVTHNAQPPLPEPIEPQQSYAYRLDDHAFLRLAIANPASGVTERMFSNPVYVAAYRALVGAESLSQALDNCPSLVRNVLERAATEGAIVLAEYAVVIA